MSQDFLAILNVSDMASRSLEAIFYFSTLHYLILQLNTKRTLVPSRRLLEKKNQEPGKEAFLA